MVKDSEILEQETKQPCPSSPIVFVSRRYVTLCKCKCQEMKLEGKKNVELEERMKGGGEGT
jgi:hypothetical protein